MAFVGNCRRCTRMWSWADGDTDKLCPACVEVWKSEEKISVLEAEVERLRELLEYCDECESAPCTMKCRTIRRAKIEVLREVLDGLHKWYDIDDAREEIEDMLKQLEAGDEQAH